MSSSTPSKLHASFPTVLELGNRRSLEVSRTVPAGNLALGTNPPGTSAPIGPMVVDAHLIAIGTPTPGSVMPHTAAAPVLTPELTSGPKTVFQGGHGFVPPSRPVTNAPRASIALALLLGLFSLVIAPLAPLAWLCAAEQLDLVARGLRRPTGTRWLHAVQGIGIAMTMVAVAATAFGITVMIARWMH
ncbi:MAG: hypothetical protein ACKV2T_17890 [Kofleriaceae bacterium]